MRLVELIGLGVVVAGWAATHLLSEARERRKEGRGQIDKVIERLQDLEKAAYEFHTADALKPTQQVALINQLDRLVRSLGRIGMLNSDALIPTIISLRRAVTLRNFDPSTFQVQAQTSDILEAIATASQDMEDEIERQYLHRYPATFPYFRWPWQI